jgi:hypothetical protein
VPRKKSFSQNLRRLQPLSIYLTIEFQNDNKLRAKHLVAEAMTEAVVRKCNKCHVRFWKEDGCNRMTCRLCKNEQCFVCSRTLEPGDFHFGQKSCPMFDDYRARIQTEANEAHDKAIRKILEAQPGLKSEDVRLNIEQNEIESVHSKPIEKRSTRPDGELLSFYAAEADVQQFPFYADVFGPNVFEPNVFEPNVFEPNVFGNSPLHYSGYSPLLSNWNLPRSTYGSEPWPRPDDALFRGIDMPEWEYEEPAVSPKQPSIAPPSTSARFGGNNPYGSRGCRACILCRRRKGKVSKKILEPC